MQQRSWTRGAVRILRHDRTLVVVIGALLAVSAGVIAGARHEPRASSPAAGSGAEASEPLEPALPAEPAPAAIARLLAQPAPPALRVRDGEIRAGETLAQSLEQQGVSPATVHVIARELSPLFDFRRARAGHRYRLSQDAEGALVEFRYRTSSIESYVLRCDGPGWSAFREEAKLEPRVVRMAGLVTSSLHDAVVALGEQGQLASDFSDIFAWDIDFSRSVQPGDEFQILYERLYRSDEGEVYVGPGRILAAHYRGAVGDYRALYFEPQEGRGGYYRPDGSSVERQFLLAPLRYSRISSRFSSARLHPILNVTRPHHGIDYAAPVGTPLWAVADGKVIYRGWAGGFGNLVKIRHNNGYVSYYAHLSRFAKGLAVGRTVQQKQVIGFVGKTGLATGPHVCFRIAKDGQYVDPARLQTPAGDPVPPELQHRFEVARELLLSELEAGLLVAVDEGL